MVKTTLEIPDPLLRQAKATAAERGVSLRELVSRALRAHLAPPRSGRPGEEGWRRVFGRASREAVAEVDAAVAELERIEPDDWR